jgi:hypothetical protein
LRVEASGVKLFGKRLMFEVDRDISEICRSGKAAGFEELALPLLRSGVVDLEDAKMSRPAPRRTYCVTPWWMA